MKKTMIYPVLIALCALLSPNAEAAAQSAEAVTKKSFDFIIGLDGDFKKALSTASAAASSGKRFYIFFPNGEYAIGALTGDANQMTTITTSNLSLIGENIDSTVISNKAKNESISTTATLFFSKANNLYLQDLTVLNKGNYGDPGAVNVTGRFVAIEDQGDKNVYKNVKLLSNQDTYYSKSSRTYWETGEIHGFVDFICGYGDVFFNRCLLYLENRSSVVITAPATQTSWGYVFMDCTIDGAAGDGYRLGRSWSNQPKCVYINTVMKKIPNAAGWGDPMNVVPALFAEYNSRTASGSAVNLSGRRTTYTKDATTVTLKPVLTEQEAAKYTVDNVLKGSDGWQPENLTKQLGAPDVSVESGMLVWDDNDSALCWMVFRDKKYFGCVTVNSCDIPPDSPKALFTVRAANAMGGLGAASDPVSGVSTPVSVLQYSARGDMYLQYNSVRRMVQLRGVPGETVRMAVYSADGRTVLSGKADVTEGAAELSIGALQPGMYVVRVRSGIMKNCSRIFVR